MHQYAWLDFYRGKWHLLTGKQADPVRIWVDRQVALAAPVKEGCEVSGPYPKRFSFKKQPKLWFYGYALMRTVH
jgi:hypothetical protein